MVASCKQQSVWTQALAVGTHRLVAAVHGAPVGGAAVYAGGRMYHILALLACDEVYDLQVEPQA